LATKDLTTVPLFDGLLSFQIEGVEVDLHNEYDCRAVSLEKNTLKLSFIHISTSQRIIILFKDVVLRLLSFDLGITDSTLDLFYRGRFEEDENVLSTYDQQGRSYFYLSFDSGSEIQLLARSVTASFT
jgi:hypothetical protein